MHKWCGWSYRCRITYKKLYKIRNGAGWCDLLHIYVQKPIVVLWKNRSRKIRRVYNSFTINNIRYSHTLYTKIMGLTSNAFEMWIKVRARPVRLIINCYRTATDLIVVFFLYGTIRINRCKLITILFTSYILSARAPVPSLKVWRRYSMSCNKRYHSLNLCAHTSVKQFHLYFLQTLSFH